MGPPAAAPARLNTFFRSSRQSNMPYVLLSSISNSFCSHKDAASVATDLRPLPPIPTMSALPRGCWMTRAMRARCSMANMNSTRSIFFFETAL